MTLIKSISGIRGTIGGTPGDALTPVDVVRFSAAFAEWVRRNNGKNRIKVVIGRDARISGDMVNRLVSGTLLGMGADVVDAGMSTTPTVEMAVMHSDADAGIILTASHNPVQWNALKLLNEKGEFISGNDGKAVLEIAESEDYHFADVHDLGKYSRDESALDRHITAILNLKLVDKETISKAGFKIAVDAVNSSGGEAIPRLLRALGVENVIKINCEPTGHFAHNPEPLPEHLQEISSSVKEHNANLGIVVDPDVDRLALVCEDGSMFGEEYTLVAVADYVLQHNKGNTVSNLSSSRALRDVTESSGGSYTASAVGEVNVVRAMKDTHAVIGGEGNGGIIYPELHYGRDALVGIALFLTFLAKTGKTCSELKSKYPQYHISKNKIELTPQVNVDRILEAVKDKYSSEQVNTSDGVKIDFEKEWVHLRKSNTEPIIRIYSESSSKEAADALAGKVMDDIRSLTE